VKERRVVTQYLCFGLSWILLFYETAGPVVARWFQMDILSNFGFLVVVSANLILNNSNYVHMTNRVCLDEILCFRTRDKF